MFKRVAGDTTPPGHFVIQKLWTSVFGADIVACRALSVLLGALSLILMFLLVVEAQEDRASSVSPEWGGILAVVVASMHLGQVGADRTARMYSMMVVLAALSSLCVLKALHSTAPKRWWAAYSLAGAGLLYTHPFAVFAVAAQVVFAVIEIVRHRNDTVAARNIVMYGGLALVGMIVLYLPWIPTAVEQTVRVRRSFWVEQLSWKSAQPDLAMWLCGSATVGANELAIVGLVAVAVVWRWSRSSLLFGLQVLIPWLAIVVMSPERPLLQARYLLCAQYAAIALIGVTCARLPTALERIIFSVVVVLPLAWNSLAFVLSTPDDTPVLARVVSHLREHAKRGDLVLVEVPEGVNSLQYYCSELAFNGVQIKWGTESIPVGAHMNHLSALATDDIVRWTPQSPPSTVDRFWVLFDAGLAAALGNVPDGWSCTYETEFVYGRDRNKIFAVALLQREASSADSATR